MPTRKVFYYHFNRINFWTFLNLFLIYILVCCAVKFRYCCYWPEYYVLLSLGIISWGLWIYKHCLKQKLAIITDTDITIDHCQPLPWKSIRYAEERIVRCGFRRLKIIVLVPKAKIKYQYNFLQKHNGPFTPFSLPLYPVITPKDAKAMRALIMKKVKYKPSPKKK